MTPVGLYAMGLVAQCVLRLRLLQRDAYPQRPPQEAGRYTRKSIYAYFLPGYPEAMCAHSRLSLNTRRRPSVSRH